MLRRVVFAVVLFAVGFGSLVAAGVRSVIAQSGPGSAPAPVTSADEFVGDYVGTCQRLVDRGVGSFQLTLRNSKGQIPGTARHISGETVIAKYGPIDFGKGRLEADALVMENQGGKRTYFSRENDGGIYFTYSTSAGTAI